MSVPDVAIIGTGNMGAALAGALLDAGEAVTVWNRTAQRCTPLVERGARLAGSVSEAVRGASTIIVCVLDYDASGAAFAGLNKHALADRVLVQFSTGSPGDARAGEAWAREHAGGYLEGAIFAYPRAVGTPDCTMIYAGATGSYQAARAVLEMLGKAKHLGEDIALANILNCSCVGIFYEVALAAFIEAAAYAEAEGASLEDFAALAPETIELLKDSIEYSLPQMRQRDYAGDEASIDVHADAVEAIKRAMEKAGGATTLTSALVQYFHLAQTAGMGSLEFSGLYDVMRAGGLGPRAV